MNNVLTNANPADQLQIVDALYRLGGGIDANSALLLESAFTQDAHVDFGPAARTMGIDFPGFPNRDVTVAALTSSVGLLDTTHVVTNPRVWVDGQTANLTAIVDAQHLPPNDHSRHCLMKNRYDAQLRLEGGTWRISRLVVQCAWYEGDPKVLLGQ